MTLLATVMLTGAAVSAKAQCGFGYAHVVVAAPRIFVPAPRVFVPAPRVILPAPPVVIAPAPIAPVAFCRPVIRERVIEPVRFYPAHRVVICR